MEISLKGKKALIGGSSRGIGRAVAVQLAESGAAVTVMARSGDALRDLVANLPANHGQQHGFLTVDFADLRGYEHIISTFLSKNPVDILVNNTQGPPSGTSLEMDTEDYQQAFDILFKTVHLTTRLALPHMKKQNWGRIINVASISVREPLPYLALSNTIRAAVATWAKTLARDVAPFGITVNTVLTGYFDTERIARLNSKKAETLQIPEDQVRSEMEATVPVGRIGKPEEYGYLVAFLASEQAAYLTGTAIPLDGGLLKSQ